MQRVGDRRRHRPPRAVVSRVSDRLALAGGVLLLALAVLVTVSVIARWLTSRGIPGDFELMQIGLALAVFAFMPLCQLRGGNLFVDTFTTRLPPPCSGGSTASGRWSTPSSPA